VPVFNLGKKSPPKTKSFPPLVYITTLNGLKFEVSCYLGM
jgi:hypothetical protein